jgi:hypothetical protein
MRSLTGVGLFVLFCMMSFLERARSMDDVEGEFRGDRTSRRRNFECESGFAWRCVV